MEDELTKCHFVLCEKSDVAFESKEATDYLQAKLDDAADTVDACEMFVEDVEARRIEDERRNEESTKEVTKKKENDDYFKRLKVEKSIDERLAKDLCTKINQLVAKKELSAEDFLILKVYIEKLQGMSSMLENYWTEVLTSSTIDQLEAMSTEIYTKKTEIHESLSKGVSLWGKREEETRSNYRGGFASSSSIGEASETRAMIKPEKMKLPTFSGNIRCFARFKKDFTKIVAPFYPDNTQRAYTLKETCLKGRAKTLVENIEDIDEMWKRLENKFGDKIDLVDVVIKEIEEVPTLKNNDDVKFIELVDKLEKGLIDLDAIGARSDLANAYTVKMIEKKLNRLIYMEWLKKEPDIEKDSRFEKLFQFLDDERRRVEKLVRKNEQPIEPSPREKGKSGGVAGTGSFAAIEQQKEQRKENGKKSDNCLVHPGVSHFTRKCRSFLSKSNSERAEILKKTKGCTLCLSTHHLEKPCPHKEKWNPCGKDDCKKYHSHLLHDAEQQGLIVNNVCGVTVVNTVDDNLCNQTLLLVQSIPTRIHGNIVTFFDSGSTISLVSSNFVKRHRLKGINVSYDLITVGGNSKSQSTFLHEICIVDHEGRNHVIPAFEIGDICGSLQNVDVSRLVESFKDLPVDDVVRPDGEIEMLIGMKHAMLHPRPIDHADGLVLYESMFGTKKVLGGCHRTLKYVDELNESVNVVASAKIENIRVVCSTCKTSDSGIDFFTLEEFGVKLIPRCERCTNCKNCTPEAHNISRVEARELSIIKENLVLDPIAQQWATPYPYKADPSTLENNYDQAEKCLLKLEKRIRRSDQLVQQFNNAFDDFVERGVLEEIEEEELNTYDGPVFYVMIHEVFKESSTSTPLRLVVNSSLKYRGKCLNDILMKGPNTLNDLFTVQLRWRCYTVAVVCDMSKMYHSIRTTKIEKHLRRVLHRDLDPTKKIRTYGINTATFGDSPAGAIAGTAVHKTADIHEDVHPEAAEKIKEDSYVDDVATGADNHEEAEDLKDGIEQILQRGGFKIKGFVTSGDSTDKDLSLLGSDGMERVLGVIWNPEDDVLRVKVRINLSKKYRQARTAKDLDLDEIPSITNMKITRRLLLSITNSCYDVFGILGPITISMKIGLRRINGSSWDEDQPEDVKKQWVTTLTKLKKAESTTFKRCLKPADATGNPILIICSDGSESAMCTTAHIRWNIEDGSVQCRLWSAKTRVTPIRKITIPSAELISMVMGVRLAESIKKSSIWRFEKIYHMTDSKCSLATLSKESSALGEFSGNRVAEILDSTEISQWYHIKSKDNIADLGTRGNATVADVDERSAWQIGPSWMYLPVEDWPVTQDVGRNPVPEEFVVKRKIVASASKEDPVIDYNKYKGKSYDFAMNLTARILRIAKSRSFRNNELTTEDLQDAEAFMIRSSMKRTKLMLDKGSLNSLRPYQKDGVIMLGGRATEAMKMFYDSHEHPILAYDDPIAYLWMKKMHNEDHTGIKKTTAKSRRRYWIVKAGILAAKIKRSCFRCRLLDKLLAQQLMAPLPKSRQMMSPTFYEVSLDLFGPFEIRDAVKKRCRMKVWGLIINCLSTRAVHVDITEGYSTEDVILTLRKFIAIRGCSSIIHSDKGSQLLSEELKAWVTSNKIE